MSIITVENLGKKYIIGHDRRAGTAYRYQSLRDTLAHTARGIYQRLRHPLSPNAEKTEVEEFWALREISFTVEPGDRVGIIGRNGAGKSTLLKILSRITEPTTGRIEISGRVACLLEVGTGFHAELTGRENIFLNGAILGMTRVEIKKKFDEIVAFAEVEKFLDTPVKRYSSGMYVRLAFAVAAHLEPEILIVDEVLAVGDAQFQKKCLGKMEEVGKDGRTVLFVSHNMPAVRNLCTSACLLEQGRAVFRGDVDQTIARYLEHANPACTTRLADRIDRRGSGKARLTAVTLGVEGTDGAALIHSGDRLRIELDYEAREPLHRPQFLVGVYDTMHQSLFRLDSQMTGGLPERLPPRGRLVCRTGPLNTAPGPCFINIAVNLLGELADHVVQAAEFNIEPSDFYGTGRLLTRGETLYLLPQEWTLDDAQG